MREAINSQLKALLPICMLQTIRFALVRFGGGVIQMSGSIAGNTFARNRYGNYVRARTKPINPVSTAQQLIRNAIGELTARWGQVLTVGQRAAWALYASNVAMKNRLGEVVYLSGFNHFIRSNSIRVMLGLTIIDAGPVIFELPPKDSALTVTGSEGTQFLTNAFDVGLDWCTEDDAYLFLFQGRPQNAQRNFFAGPWRYLVKVAGIDPGGCASPVVTAGVFAIAEGQHQWVYGRISRADGRLSEPFRDDCFTAA